MQNWDYGTFKKDVAMTSSNIMNKVQNVEHDIASRALPFRSTDLSLCWRWSIAALFGRDGFFFYLFLLLLLLVIFDVIIINHFLLRDFSRWWGCGCLLGFLLFLLFISWRGVWWLADRGAAARRAVTRVSWVRYSQSTNRQQTILNQLNRII